MISSDVLPSGVSTVDPADSYFDQGDYTSAFHSATTAGIKGASLIMLGNFKEGIRYLSSPNSGRERYAFALAQWWYQDKALAIHSLRQISDQDTYKTAALELEKIIHRGGINVLMQGREDVHHRNYDIVGTLKQSKFAAVKSMGICESSDVYCSPSTHIDTVLSSLPKDWQPDLYFNCMVEDHPPPIGIEAFPFPKICHTQDYDRHFSQVYHYFSLFDSAIVLGKADHQDIMTLVQGKTFIFPLLFGVSNIQTRWHDKRDIDIFLSGTNFNNNDGKAEIIWKLISTLSDKYKIVLHDGFVNPNTYYNLLSRSKCTISYVNRWGLLNSRSIEALSQGCIALYQAGGELGIYINEQEGAVSYQMENFIEKASEVIDHWNSQYSIQARNGQSKLATLFMFEDCMQKLSILLCAYTAILKSTSLKVKKLNPEFSNARFINRSLGRIPYLYDSCSERAYIYYESLIKPSVFYPDQFSLSALGEYYLYRYIHRQRDVTRQISYKFNIELASEFLFKSRDIFENLCELNKKNIASYFNLARIYYEMGEFSKAASIFEFILGDRDLIFDPNQTLFWREFHDSYFSYDEFMRKIVSFRLYNDQNDLLMIISMIRDSCLVYLWETQEKNKNISVDLAEYILKQFSGNLFLSRLVFLIFTIYKAHDKDYAHGLLNQFLLKKPWMIIDLFRSNSILLEDNDLQDYIKQYRKFELSGLRDKHIVMKMIKPRRLRSLVKKILKYFLYRFIERLK